MERNPNIYCDNVHIVTKLCYDQKCSKIAIICGQPNCEFYSKHQKCKTIQIAHFIQQLIRKRENIFEFTDSIVRFYQDLLKTLQTDLKQYLKYQSQTEFKLQKDEEKLFEYLKEGHTNKIQPSLIYKVNKFLNSEHFNSKDNEVQKTLQQQVNKIENILENIKSIWNKNSVSIIDQIVSKDNYSFDKQLRKKLWTSIKENGKILQFNKFTCFALVAPSILQDTKINFKIIKLEKNLLGICFQKFLKENKFQLNNEFKGGEYGIFNDGQMRSHTNEDQHRKKSQFKFKVNDIVEIRCSFGLQKVIFTNKTTSCPIVEMDFIKEQEDMLHFVVFGCWGCQVEIVD